MVGGCIECYPTLLYPASLRWSFRALLRPQVTVLCRPKLQPTLSLPSHCQSTRAIAMQRCSCSFKRIRNVTRPCRRHRPLKQHYLPKKQQPRPPRPPRPPLLQPPSVPFLILIWRLLGTSSSLSNFPTNPHQDLLRRVQHPPLDLCPCRSITTQNLIPFSTSSSLIESIRRRRQRQLCQ